VPFFKSECKGIKISQYGKIFFDFIFSQTTKTLISLIEIKAFIYFFTTIL